MRDAIAQVLALGVGVAISPLPVVAMVLVLTTARARANGPAFLLGWIVGLAVVGTVVLLVSDGAEGAAGGPTPWVGWVSILLGVLAVLAAVAQWRRRPRDGAVPEVPRWMRTVDTFGTGRAAGAGAVLVAANPKNLLLTIAAAVTVAQAALAAGQQAVAFGTFAVLGSLGVGVPLALFLVLGERSRRLLAQLRTWLVRHNAAIMAVLLLVIGAKLIGDGISAL